MDIKTLLYSTYILIWPTLTLGVLIYICRAVWRDAKRAKKQNRDLI